MTSSPKHAAFATVALLALVAIPSPAAADPDALDCSTFPPATRYETLCFVLHTGHEWYHCSLDLSADGPGIAVDIATFMVANAGPMLQDVKCNVAGGVNQNIHWWNDVWLSNGRPVYCFAWGPSPEACPASPDGVRVEATEYAVCVLTPGRIPTACALPSPPPAPMPRVPGPPPYP